MLDILHYLFESDAVGEKEEQDAKIKMRRTIYSQLYERSYTWGEETSGEFGTQDASGGNTFSSSTGTGGTQLEHKPYIPPTPVNANAAKPFGTVLDAPLG